MPELSLKEQLELPIVKELLTENEGLRDTSTLAGTILPDKKIAKMSVPHTFKNKLVMQAGEFNGVNYEKQDLISALAESDNSDLMYDHLDTKKGEGASAFVGKLTKPHWGINEQGEGILADLVIVDLPCAQKLALGAKWGVSPTINFDSEEAQDGSVTGRDLLWKSFSFVTDPAIRATMLNAKKKEVSPMAHEPEKKVPYKFPKDGSAMQKKQKEAVDTEMSSIDVPENVLEILEKKDTLIAELQEFKDKIVLAQKNALSTTLAYNEFLIGRVAETELESRQKELSEKAPEILKELSEVIGEHAELQTFKQFVTAFLKKNADKDIKAAALAYTKQKGKGTIENKEEEVADTPDTAELQTQQLTAPANTRETAELSEKELKDIDTDIANEIAKDFGLPEVV